MRKTFVRVDMPKRKYSKFLRVEEFLDKDHSLRKISHDLFAAQSLYIEAAFSRLFDYLQTVSNCFNL